MKTLLFALACCFGLHAGQVDYTYTDIVYVPTTECMIGCNTLEFTVPQFDLALGELDGITWTFTDNQTLMPDGAMVGVEYTVTTGVYAQTLGLFVMQDLTLVGDSLWPYSMASTTLQASGSITDVQPWIGTGPMVVDVNSWGSGVFLLGDLATLSVTYHDAAVVPEVPEPCGYGYLVVIAGGLIWIWKKR